MMRRYSICLCLIAMAMANAACAQALRDPTLAPPDASPVSTATGGKSGNAEAPAMSVLVRDGRPYLVLGTRLYAQGQMLGQARIEKIGETEVLLREGGALRKVALFHDIERHEAAPETAKPACTPVNDASAKPAKKLKTAKLAAKTTPPAAPCAAVQP
jgi:hypothetical protein